MKQKERAIKNTAKIVKLPISLIINGSKLYLLNEVKKSEVGDKAL